MKSAREYAGSVLEGLCTVAVGCAVLSYMGATLAAHAASKYMLDAYEKHKAKRIKEKNANKEKESKNGKEGNTTHENIIEAEYEESK